MVASGRVSAKARRWRSSKPNWNCWNRGWCTDDGAELALARLFAAMRLTPETTCSLMMCSLRRDQSCCQKTSAKLIDPAKPAATDHSKPAS
jgi:hypothetical protein